MPSGRIRINSSSVPGRRVGLTIPTTPRHSAKPIDSPQVFSGSIAVTIGRAPNPTQVAERAGSQHDSRAKEGGRPRDNLHATAAAAGRGRSNMYAWRARVGLIKPTHRGKGFHFWYNRAPEGVEIVPTFVGFRRSDRQTFENAFERIEAIADDLQAVGCNIVVVSGTPPILLKGLDFEREWGDRLSQKIGLPVVTQMEPHALALLALGVKRVAIATYYGDELNNAIVRYFGRFDIEGMVLGGLHLAGRQEALYTTSLRALDEVS